MKLGRLSVDLMIDFADKYPNFLYPNRGMLWAL